MSNADTLVRKQDLNRAAQEQKKMFALKTEIPDDYIVSGEQTTTSNTDGGTNVYTFTKKGGGTSTITVKNGKQGTQGESGKDGSPGQDGTSAEWFTGTAVTGTSSSAVTATATGSKAGDMYLNTSTCNVYRATAANKWLYVCNIKGLQGLKGDPGNDGTRGSKIHWGTAVTGTSSTAAVFSSSGITSALVDDLYINTSNWNIYQCTVAGAASAAKWLYIGNIKGATGSSGTTASTGTATSAGLTRLYTGTGTNTNGTMTQKAITEELEKCIKTDEIEWLTEEDIEAMYASVQEGSD